MDCFQKSRLANVLNKFVVVSKISYLTDNLKLFNICSKFKGNRIKRKVKFMQYEKFAASAIGSSR